MTTTMQELWSLMQTGEFWKNFAYTVRGWALGLAIATVLAVPLGILLGASDFAGRAFRVPIEFLRPIPSAVLIPLLFLTLGTIAEERGLPGRVRRVLAAARADDLRRTRRRPGRNRHRAVVRSRAVRASLPDHAAERDAVHRHRPAHLVDRLAHPRLHGRALHGDARARPGDELRAVVRPQRPAVRARGRHRLPRARRSTSPWSALERRALRWHPSQRAGAA